MKTGGRVTYIDAKGNRHAATITDVSGTGKSGYKTLDLAFGEEEAKKVAHSGDQEEGDGFWLLIGEKQPVEEEEPKAAPAARRKAAK